jgi:tetratricopeptide (TPR) repeat protein
MEVTFLARAGRVEATEQLADTMVATPLEPRAAIVNGLRRAAASFAACGDTAAAHRLLGQALAALDAASSGRAARERADRAAVLYELGRFDEANTLWTQVLASDTGNVDARGYLGLIAAQRHDTLAAAATDAWLAETRPRYVFTRTMYRARIAALLGKGEQALDLLGLALDEMNRFLVPGVREYAELASLKSDERFGRLMSLR